MSCRNFATNPVTGDWVILATERARRPEDFARKKERPPLPPRVEGCPFCLGNEHLSVPERLRLADEAGHWLVRVVDNKFAALTPTGGLPDGGGPEGPAHRLPGYGYHEVVIETPAHHLTTALLPVAHVRLILEAYRRRFLAFFEDRHIAHAILYKNHGVGAGTSLEHPHSQLVAMPMIPSQVRGRMADGQAFHQTAGDCLHCRQIAGEEGEGTRVVATNRTFVAFIPFAALSAFHVWIFPRRHQSCFTDLSEEGFADLAAILKEVLGRLYVALDNPDFNYVIRTAGPAAGPDNVFHWYVSVIPRLSLAAGFELGTGMFINTAFPEASAAFLRGAAPPP